MEKRPRPASVFFLGKRRAWWLSAYALFWVNLIILEALNVFGGLEFITYHHKMFWFEKVLMSVALPVSAFLLVAVLVTHFRGDKLDGAGWIVVSGFAAFVAILAYYLIIRFQFL